MQGMRLVWALLAAVVVGVSACASAPIRPQDRAELVVAATRLLDGCYECLLEARATYQRLAVGRARPLLVTQLFEAEVLVGLREREFAVDHTDAFQRAEALLKELPPTYPGARYLEIARLMPTDRLGTPRAIRIATERTQPPLRTIRAIQEELSVGAGSPHFREYLSIGLECLGPAQRAATAPLAQPADDAPYLVKYRTWTCPAEQPYGLEAIRDAVPDFVEAELLVARVPTLQVTSAYTTRLREALDASVRRLPRSPAIAYSLGALNQTVGDCRAAIRHYEDVIALAPLHEDAAMQRVICLGHLGQFVPAIDGATRIIDRAYDNRLEAMYWRAWSHHQRRDLPAARADIDAARAIMVSVRVLVLSGMIKYDQGALDSAESDLADAIRMDTMNEQCLAHWYYALVGFAREQWPDTAERFGRASTCYRRSAEQARRDLARMRTANVDEEFRANQVAGFEAAIKEDVDQEHASYLNAANAWARGGEIDKAREWLGRIPADSIHATVAAELRKQIGGSVTQ